MNKYYFNGVPVGSFSEPKDNKGFRDGKFWVKVFSEEESFSREKEMLEAVASCPGVVKVDQAGVVDIVAEDGGKTSYPAIREWYAGEKDIRAYCAKHYGEEEIKALFLMLAGNLFQLEESIGIIHNDVKPGNVLISDDGEPVLIDFNISKKVSEPMAAIHTHATPRFSDPKKGMGMVSVQGDIYSFGQVLDACLWQNPDGPKAYSKGLLAFRDKCREEPDKRYASFGEVMAAMEKLGKEDTEIATEDVPVISNRKIDIRQFVVNHVPTLTKVLYGISIFFFLLGIYMILRPKDKEPVRVHAANPSLKEDCSIVITDIKNLINKSSHE